MPTIQKGDTVLVTGANGFIASHVVDQLIIAGYKARGVVRSEEKGRWLQELMDERHGKGKLELAVIPDYTVDGAFDEALKGVAGVAHVASIVSPSPDPNKVIPGVLAIQESLLKAAAKHPNVKRFVLTSSSAACVTSTADLDITFDENTYNEQSVKDAWAPPPYEQSRARRVYAASKTQSEQAFWKFIKEEKPPFEGNSIVPNANFGELFNRKEQQPSTSGWAVTLYEKGLEGVSHLGPQWFVDVQDDARLHVSALANPHVVNERIFGFAAPYNWTVMLKALRKVRPDHEWPEDPANEGRDLSKPLPRVRAEEILRQDYGKGFTSLEESLKANLAFLEKGR